ncbi:hypothetical protein PspCFBP13509_08730 [Pseudomonas sp. CFBP13509]|uniref:hypothetical protein n=1 Tax=Pseudomonas sp. CFBP13509 TaxID=2184008 RepID=UPI0010C002C9|nr:hypothetical protein [Pseudomonas sp. CFBP13509]TKJ80309.1 hypothetical protein PspCFBP13509_08730 [Pseudomonas sp. CFBP13509]
MYEPNSFSSTEKLFYRPIEAAIRWCDLIAHEAEILEAAWATPERLINTFPQWPCLHANTGKILDAIRNQELPYGALGTTVIPGTPVDIKLLTIRHSDLKRWILHYHPDQRPSFLFIQSASSQETIHYSTYLILQADRDALQVQLKATEAKLQALIGELKAAGLEREHLRMLAENKQQLSDHSKVSFLNVIGALVDIMLGSSTAGRRHSIFDSQASIVDSITAHYGGITGLSKRSLDEKFAAGRRSLAQAKR